jgi:hypothetical protein
MHLVNANLREFAGVRVERVDEDARFTVREGNNEVGVVTNVREKSVGTRCGGSCGDGRILPVAWVIMCR